MITYLKTASLFLAEENHAKVGYNYLAVAEINKFVEITKAFYKKGFHLEEVSGLVVSEGAVSLYRFDHFDHPCRITILLISDADKAEFPSIASIFDGAEWHERETRDFFGFIYTDNPNFVPLLLAEDMAHIHPLLKPDDQKVSLAAIFSQAGRERKVLFKDNSFTLLETPVKEETPEAPQPKTEEKASEKTESKARTLETKAEEKTEIKPAAKVIEKSASTEAKAAPKTANKADSKPAAKTPKKETQATKTDSETTLKKPSSAKAVTKNAPGKKEQ